MTARLGMIAGLLLAACGNVPTPGGGEPDAAPDGSTADAGVLPDAAPGATLTMHCPMSTPAAECFVTGFYSFDVSGGPADADVAWTSTTNGFLNPVAASVTLDNAGAGHVDLSFCSPSMGDQVTMTIALSSLATQQSCTSALN